MCYSSDVDHPEVNSSLKYTLFSFSVIYWLFGLGLVVLGIYACIEKEMAISDFGRLITDPAIIILTFGCSLFILTFFACVGAIRENICMLKFFSIVLALSLVLQFTAGFVLIVLSDHAEAVVDRYFSIVIEKYREDIDLQNIIDWGQEEFQCCGITTYKEWDLNKYFSCSQSNPSFEQCSVPWSCCKVNDPNAVKNTLCGIGVRHKTLGEIEQQIYTEGCLTTMIYWLHNHIFILAFLAVALAIPQIVGVCLSRILLLQIKDCSTYQKAELILVRQVE